MCCTTIFACIMAMISNFPIIYVFRELFQDSFPSNITHFACDFSSFFVKGNIFSFHNQLYFLRVLLKIHKAFSYNLFRDIRYVCFLCDQVPKLLAFNKCKEYAHLFLLLKNFLDYLHIHLSF